MPRKSEKLQYIDLFAGCGGVSLGLYNSGHWHGIFAIEKNPMAFETLRHNLIDRKKHFSWPDWLPKTEHDINEVLKAHEEELKALQGSIDLVVGGPPCQGFSLAGKRNESDDRNNLIFAYLQFVELVKPKFIFFENVKGFTIGFKDQDGNRGKPYSVQVLEQLKALGYTDANYRVLDFSKFGVPQRRERCVIVGSLDGRATRFFDQLENGRQKFLKKNKLSENPKLDDALSDLLSSNGSVPSFDTKGFQNGIYMDSGLSPYQQLMRRDLHEGAIPDSHRLANHSPAIVEKFRTIIEQVMTPKEIRERFKTKKSTTTLLKAEKSAPTLTTLPDDFVHYSEPRILTVREYARIQSFNDWYEIRGNYTTGGPLRKKEVPRYTQLGNAVPPLFVEFAGSIIASNPNPDAADPI
jgi:DNA (cytosine-5)-methyltransferase 1